METKKSYLKQIKGLTFAAKGDSNHWITMDGPEHVGGNNAGARPKELILMALAGCTASDVVSILQKKRVNLTDFEINITAQQTDNHPKVFSELDLEYVFYGKDIKTKDIERAIELSTETYCGVSAMLSKAMKINHSYRIVEQ
ncbi:MAG: OsmC family protein [Ignavibacteria bacterium]|nr:OsmC family protein [Ignavibacteria bacterium]MBT8382788.1 OsmC family protein [Ignavibacteria bacterium]MBT8392675.1 OsmC family protein [Ignavibacteria bacterium]NNJ52545.1 osmotically inducible protein OsmC [Ignavibacteriaceae bacterium]NNL21990.1 osmotically inducible protein OsmC [Ignavibacteriaceae bacterium]